MKKKLIIITTLIIRGDYHKKSLGNFYKDFNQYLKDFEVYHIINIDEPEHLKNFFNKYETIDLLNKIIPKEIKKIYIDKENPGFLNAYKKTMDKIEELKLNSEKNIYWWFEDDWEHVNKNINIFKICSLFTQLKNSSLMFSKSSPLGSFRAGPIMSGSYFLNFFNIHRMSIPNNLCDPERQVRRWLTGKEYNIGNKKIHRIINKNNDTIDIIQLAIDEKVIHVDKFLRWYYPGKYFNKELKFNFHVIKINNLMNEFSYCKVENDNKIKLNKINKEDLFKIFENENIKYINFIPHIFADIGRNFNDKFSLTKWTKIIDNTKYSSKHFKILQIGNENDQKLIDIRLNYNNTFNKTLYSGILNLLNDIYNYNYELQKINYNIKYFSHIYGSYPNFNIIGNLIKLNYKPELINENEIIENDMLIFNNDLLNSINYNSFNKYFNEIFVFDKDIITRKIFICLKFKDKKVISFFFDNKNIDEYKKIILNYKDIETFDFILTNKVIEIEKLKDKIINFDDHVFNINERFEKIKNIINQINQINLSSENRVELEMKLKKLTKDNEKHLNYIILKLLIFSYTQNIVSNKIDFLILSKVINLNTKVKYIQ